MKNVTLSTLALLIAATPLAFAEEEKTRGSFIEEVVVTAEKREESEMTVPIAVTAFDEHKIEKLNIQTIDDLSLMTPGLEVQTHAGNNLFAMRGVGTSFSSWHANESSVAVYQNGLAAVAANVSGIDTNGFDIERIEVLRGPQNTIYGRNAMGGTINYIRKKPQSEFGADIVSELSTEDGRRLGIALTGPITESVAWRLTGYTQQRDGFQKNLSTATTSYCPIGECTNKDLDDVDINTIIPQLQITRDTWSLNISASSFDSKRRMGRNEVGPIPAGFLPEGLRWPTHIQGDGELGSYFGWDTDLPQEGAVQMNRDPIHYTEGEQFVITLDWDITDNMSIRYQRGRSDTEELRFQDRDKTDRTGTAGDPPVADDNGGYFRDRISMSEGHYIVDQNELTLSASFGDAIDLRIGYFTLDSTRIIGAHDRHYEVGAYRTSTIDEMRALHAAGGMPGLGDTFPDVSSCSELLQQKFGQPYLTAEDNGAPAFSLGPDHPWGFRPGRLNCYGPAGTEVNRYGGTDGPFGGGVINNQQHQKSWFGEIAYQVNDQWSASLGLRRIDDEKPTGALDGFNVGPARFNPFAGSIADLDEYAQEAYYANLGVAPPIFLNTAYLEHLVLKFERTVFNFDVEYTPDENTFIFGRVASGYRSGGGNFRVNTQLGDFAPFYLFDEEDLLTYEVGYKRYYDDYNLRIMTSAYFYDFDNFITGAAITLTPQDPWDVAFEGNINYGKVEIYGFDFEFAWQVPSMENLQIFGFYAYNKGEVKEPFVLPAYTGEEGFAGYSFIGAFEGNSLPYAPKQKFNLNAEYTWPLDNGSSVSLLGVWAWTGKFEANVANNAEELADDFSRVDLRLTWTSADERYRVSAYGQNIFDDRQIEQFEVNGFEFEDPDTGEERFIPVPEPFVSAYEMWGIEVRASL